MMESWCRPQCFLDLKDAGEKWQAAYVVSVSDQELELHPETGRELWLPLHSSRLAPFRRYSTGSHQSSFSTLWPVTHTDLENFQRQVAAMDTAEAFYITQFYRGEMLYRLLGALDRGYDCGREELELIVMKVIIPCAYVVVRQWLANLKGIYSGLNLAQSNPDSVQTDPQVAYAASFPELALCLRELLGEDKETVSALRRLDECWQDMNRPSVRRSPDLVLMQELIGDFQKEGGFERLVEMIRDESERMPLELLGALPLLSLFQYCSSIDTIKHAHEAVKARLTAISDRDVRDYDQNVRKVLITNLLDLQKYLRIENIESIRFLELDISLKLLKSSYLEKRIRGLNDIKDMIEESQRNKGQGFWSKNQYLDTNQMVDWLQREKVVELLTGEHTHVELLKRAADIFELLCRKKKLTSAHLQAVWRSAEAKHETYVRGVYDLVAHLPAWLNAADTKALFELILRERPEVDEKFLTLLKNFTKAAFDAERKRGQPEAEDLGAAELLNMALLGQNEQALTTLVELLTECQYTMRKSGYCEKALRMFAEGTAVPQALQLSLLLLESLDSYTRDDIFRRFNYKSSLIADTADSIVIYEDTVRSLNLREDCITYDNTLHSKHLSLRFRLLSLLTKASKLDVDRFEGLWRVLVLSPVLESDAVQFFNWLVDAVPLKSVDAQRVMMCFKNLDKSKASVAAFTAFKCALFTSSKINQRLDIRGQQIIRRWKAELPGFETAFSFVLDASNAQVNSLATALVTECLVLLSHDVSVDTVWRPFLRVVLQELQSSEWPRVARVLQLCHALVEPKSEPMLFQSAAPRVTFHLSLPQRRIEKISVPNDAPLCYLRQKVAALLKTHPSKVTLQASYRLLDFEEDDKPVSKALAHTVYITAEIANSLAETVRPKELFGANEELYEELFRLAAEATTSQLAWELLMKLPTSKMLKRQLEVLSRDALAPPSASTFHRSLYSLVLIAELCQKESYSDRLLANKDGQVLIKSVFEAKTTDYSGLLIAKFTEVVCQLSSKLLRRQPTMLKASLVLHQSVNYLHSLVQKPTPDSEVAVAEVKRLLEVCPADTALVVSCFATHPRLKEVLVGGLIRCEYREIRRAVSEFLLSLCESPFNLEQILLQKMLEILPAAQSAVVPLHYFETLSILVSKAGTYFLEELDSCRRSLFASFVNRAEKSSSEVDEGLLGGLSLACSIVKTQQQESAPTDLQFVLENCLLSTAPLCRHSQTRSKALQLLGEMLACSPSALPNLSPQLLPLFLDPRGRSGRFADWEVSAEAGERAVCGFAGIRNTGCICYMISVLQQLFMLRSFRSQLLSLPISHHDQTKDNMLQVCQRIFINLMHSNKQYISIKRLCEALKGSSAVQVNEQMDVEEFLNAFMDKLEGKLGPHRAVISNHFAGQLATEIIGKAGCCHSSERVEQFLTLPLELKTKKSLQESLESLVQGETLEGDNAYQCDACGARVTAQRRVGIRHLPNVLLLALRRFDYDLDSMRRVKINDYYEFPWELDLEPYTIEGLHRKDQRTEADKEEVSHSEATLPADYYQYRLRGIVIHMGSAEGGHYYCFIQDRDSGKWLEFNDTLVREVDQADIPAEAYGGEEQFSVSSYYGDVTEVQEKVSSAYLLLYERAGQYAVRDPADKEVKKTVLAQDLPASDSVKALIDQVAEKNWKFWSRKNVFAHEFADFVLRLLQSQASDLDILKLGASFFLTVIIRAKDKYALPSYLKALKAALQVNAEACKWVVEVLTVPSVVQELFLACPQPHIRRLVLSLVKNAVGSIEEERRVGALERVLSVLPKAKESLHYTQYFELIYILSQGCILPRDLDISSRLFDFLLERPMPDSFPPPAPIQPDLLLGYHDFAPSDLHFKSEPPSQSPSITYLLATLASVELTEEEKELALSLTCVKLCIRKLEGKAGARQAAALYAGLIRDNDKQGRLLLGALLESFTEELKDRKKLILRVISQLLSLEDAFSENRALQVLSELSIRMKAAGNLKDRSIVELLGQFLFKLCIHNEHACVWVSQPHRPLSWLDDWVRRWSYPHYYSADALDTDIAKKLRGLAAGKASVSTEEWDSDEDVNFSSTARVKLYRAITDAYEYVVVTEDLGEVARGKPDNRDATVWLETDSDDIKPLKY